ncbi:MAG: AraC family transcriptional regulator [Polyangiales bacterium]
MTAPRAGADGGTPESTVSMRVVRELARVVEAAGSSQVELLRAAGIAAEQLEVAEARLLRSEVYRICEIAIDLTADPALGLHWAEGLTLTTFNPVSYLIAHSASLRQGLESLSRFERLLSDEPCFELLEHADEVTLRCPLLAGGSLRMQRFAAEMTVACFFQIIRSFGVRPEQVSLEYAAPAYHHEYTRIFGEAVRFEQPLTGMVFDRGLLDAASPHKDEDVHEALRTLAERRMARLQHCAPYALRVREFLVQQRRPRLVDMKVVACALGLSMRSLRRRLAAEGKSYSAVEKDALAIVARRLLRDEQRTIQETAYEMGFSDKTAFHRAFKSWTGTTPSAYQESR